MDDRSLIRGIYESAAQPALCISQVLQSQGLTVALSEDASKKCGFDAEIDKAAVAIKRRFPDISATLAKSAAAKCVGWMLLASPEGANGSK
jgi:hypothetical protein